MKIRGSMMAVAMLVAVSAPAFAQETGSTTETGAVTDGVRAPGGLYDATPHTRKSQVSLWVLPSWWYASFGVGARYAMPLIADGFLAEMNDSVELEFGADAYFLSWYGFAPNVIIPVEGRWTFHVLPNFSLYGKVIVGVDVDFQAGASFLSPVFDVVPGLMYKVGESMTLRAEAGYRGFRAGIGFDF